jgi:thiol:disulfide interchange protein
MLPITLAVIGAGAQARSRMRGLAVGTVYGAGMAISYGAAGAAVVVSGATFGALNSSASFNLAIAVLFVVMSLAMFDIVHIDFTRFRGTAGGGGKRGLAGVFVLGVVTALLAGACVAPVVISVVVYATAAYAEGSVAALLLPLLLGVGMALPWPLAGAGLSLLPKPGGWMVWVRNGFGVAILAIALYYGYTGVQLLRTALPPEQAAATGSSHGEGLEWGTSLVEGLERGLEEGRPVFVDFWATWCKNCHAMDATTFRDSAVVAELKRYVLVKYQAEKPKESPAREILRAFSVIGLPTYAVLEPSNDE